MSTAAEDIVTAFNGHTFSTQDHAREWLVKQIDAAITAEREACAKIADEWGKRKDQITDTAFVPGACHGERYAADGIYNAIRSRGSITKGDKNDVPR